MAGDVESGTTFSERQRSAHQRAADAHQHAAEVHEAAAAFFDEHRDQERATRERAAAVADAAEARREQQAAQLEVAETRSPGARLVEIQTRLEQIRAESVAVLERARQTLEASTPVRDREAAHRRVSRLRSDLDTALEEVAGLRTAMETRGVIEQAKGMIMITLKVDADAAFDVLVQRSQTTHRKLVDVARDVVDAGTKPGAKGPVSGH